MAGYETTANTLAWAWYLLAHAPWAEEAVHEEAVRVCGDRTPQVEDVPDLVYCRAVIEETLRLYPPVSYLVRQARRAGRIGKAEVRPAEIVMVIPWLLHRSPDLWDQPNHFMPERFLAAERPASYAYVPFAAGPRICPGMTLGLSEAVLCLAALGQRFSLAMAPGARVEPQCRLTLRPRHGVEMIIRRREGASA
jgi:cytochrome P450